MNKIILAIGIVLASAGGAFSKTVRFSVDMTGTTVDSRGLHVMGDFQTAAGYAGGDLQPDKTTMQREGTTQIYSVTVNIPAFKAYQFKYVNGDQFYDAEFVPAESRVNKILNDYRWVYVDSLNTDTAKIAAVVYGSNAPAGLHLLRFRVDMRHTLPVTAAGAHVAGSFQGSDPAKTRLYSWTDSVYEYIAYVSSGNYDYKYYSGNTAATAETVPAACAASGTRSIAVSSDTVLNAICFASCSACVTTGITPTATNSSLSVTVVPNPAVERLTVSFQDTHNAHTLILTDAAGRVVHYITATSAQEVSLPREGLAAGLYYLKVMTADGNVFIKKIALQ